MRLSERLLGDIKDPFTGREGGRLPIFPFDPNQRLDAFFETFQPGEPFPVTKQRVDRTKGFTDTLSNIIDPIGFVEQFSETDNPKGLFGLFPDGFHTPALKAPNHPTFNKNSFSQRLLSRILQDGFEK